MKGRILVAALAVGVVLSGCGGSSKPAGTTTHNAPAGATPLPAAKAAAGFVPAQNPDLSKFPKTDGKKTLSDVLAKAGAIRDLTFVPGAQTFVRGVKTRLPFTLTTSKNIKVWGPTAVYMAKDAKSPARGPYPAVVYSLEIPPQFRSTNAPAGSETTGAGVYVALIKSTPSAAVNQLVTLTDVDGAMHSTSQGVGFVKPSAVLRPGQRMPRIDTPTVASVGGKSEISRIDTRVPPDDMHNISLKRALGDHKPTVLVVGSPAHCDTDACAIDTDVAASLQLKYGGRVAFIHDEFYNGNNPKAGVRPEMTRWKIVAQPHVFVIDRQGRVYANFEGPVSPQELTRAIKAVL